MKHIIKFSESFSDNDITSFTNTQLIGYFKDAVMDYNYNPSSKDYNTSGFSLDELESEVIRRMQKDEDEEVY